MKYTYLLIDIGTLVLPFFFSFHKRIRFSSLWPGYLPALSVAAAIFLAWDSYFTKLGVWRFNPRYLTGAYIGNLPVEEWLFFWCIPYACVFTLYCRRLFSNRQPGKRTRAVVTATLIVVLGLVGLAKLSCRYTSSTCLSLAFLLAFTSYVCKVSWLGRFYTGWLILLVPLIVVDGVLTGTGLVQPVVLYRNVDTLGIRLGTIPIEDFLYGMELILLNVLLFDRLNKLGQGRLKPGAGKLAHDII